MTSHIDFTASKAVREALANLGRTEDLKLSPSNRKLALAGFNENKILVLDIDIRTSSDRKQVLVNSYLEITSPTLRKPHGLFFIDEETIIVTNREGAAPIFRIPTAINEDGQVVLPALKTISGDTNQRLFSPGSVSVFRNERDQYDVFICNNYAHYVTRHALSGDGNFTVLDDEILLSYGLKIPDGIALNKTGRWIAISNHDEHCVYLYENTSRLNKLSEPDGILHKINYPHGVRFTQDDNFILVADAGAPYVHLYEKNGESWRGVRNPVFSFRVLDETTYLKGRYNPQEGGPKGIDIDNNMQVLVTTCQEQVLAFFDLPKILSRQPLLTAHQIPVESKTMGFPWC